MGVVMRAAVLLLGNGVDHGRGSQAPTETGLGGGEGGKTPPPRPKDCQAGGPTPAAKVWG